MNDEVSDEMSTSDEVSDEVSDGRHLEDQVSVEVSFKQGGVRAARDLDARDACKPGADASKLATHVD